MSTDKRRKRPTRTDNDPVRVYKDGRISYWTGGRPGAGKRTLQRCRTVEEAEAVAVKLRVRLARIQGAAPEARTTLDQSFQAMLIWMRENNRPSGTISQYKSNWNKWVPADIGATRCIDVELRHWAAIFDHATKNDASKPTIKAVARTLNAFTTFAFERGYFDIAEPFGEPRARRSIVTRARNSAPDPSRHHNVTLEQCPTLADVEKFALAFEEHYPGYGYRLVMLALGTGMRINELLALRHDSINLRTGEVNVNAQLDRATAWPAARLPKGNKTRTALMWSAIAPIAATLIEDSLKRPETDPEHGWLFPRHRSTTSWADRAGYLAGRALSSCDWDWTFHWLRHAYASYSLAPKDAGGYGLDLKAVSEWLGHSRPSITQDMYVERHTNDVTRAQETTALLPGVTRSA
ncbi:site-specific integrase [Aeromicrobium sp. Root472D3]|uniref:tyrosine-type recombinase/integrase n=1 Tax=Aeromicrobium sp. Root472D3 TaxID=1736540 RepID=UPI0006F897E9|nr:site-specific integrase [Aeromicrobium sp. Root472D3]KQX74492.1 hypothetical protein ASD10_04450 [Aeromicrobium sp. Root472D3]